MIVVLDDRAGVADGYVALFRREGVAACAMAPRDLPDWLIGVSDADLVAVEAFIVGEVAGRSAQCQLISTRTRAVMIATKETLTLEETLELFSAGVDDVVRKPIHVREIMARISAVARRRNVPPEPHCLGEISCVRRWSRSCRCRGGAVVASKGASHPRVPDVEDQLSRQ